MRPSPPRWRPLGRPANWLVTTQAQRHGRVTHAGGAALCSRRRGLALGRGDRRDELSHARVAPLRRLRREALEPPRRHGRRGRADSPPRSLRLPPQRARDPCAAHRAELVRGRHGGRVSVRGFAFRQRTRGRKTKRRLLLREVLSVSNTRGGVASRNIHVPVAPAASPQFPRLHGMRCPRLHGIPTWHSATPRNIHVAPAASPRCPRLHGIPTWRSTTPRNTHVAPTAPPRQVKQRNKFLISVTAAAVRSYISSSRRTPSCRGPSP